mmetsp:Transcript_43157/g.143700  ORF Transcript_43157/g.143700 Transcript_43157/m.143700 type:complete len:247 (+) Transcript_43157:409-1149(+)
MVSKAVPRSPARPHSVTLIDWAGALQAAGGTSPTAPSLLMSMPVALSSPSAKSEAAGFGLSFSCVTSKLLTRVTPSFARCSCSIGGALASVGSSTGAKMTARLSAPIFDVLCWAAASQSRSSSQYSVSRCVSGIAFLRIILIGIPTFAAAISSRSSSRPASAACAPFLLLFFALAAAGSLPVHITPPGSSVNHALMSALTAWQEQPSSTASGSSPDSSRLPTGREPGSRHGTVPEVTSRPARAARV